MRGTLPELLLDARREYPDRVSVEDPSDNSSLTYAELGAAADRVAQMLREAGVVRGDRVGICAPKSPGTVAAIHGILSAGAAYVPVDAASPPDRNAGIFRDCGAAAVIASTSLIDRLVEGIISSPVDVRVIDDRLSLLCLRGAGNASSAETSAEDVYYILYTSGSTGQPKGVVHTHASARAFVDWCVEAFEPTKEDRFSSHAPFHFDLSILDLFVPAAVGGRVVLISDEVGKQPLRLAGVIQQHRITIWYSTPSALRLLSGHGRLEQHDHSSIRLVLFAGEVFPASALRQLRERWTHPRYFNLYGPTETNVCTFLPLPEAADPDRTIPYSIGFPCAGDIARVVDAEGNDVPDGDEGELLIAGPTVMREYWNLPDRTASSFVNMNGRRWYRTGDLVRNSAEGFIFLGRRDRMVKRRGYRVELGEIEAALSLHPDVTDCAVVAQPDDDTGVRIHAALVVRPPARPSLVSLKQFSSSKLPLYMVPDRFSIFESIPQTSTGKVDYQRLKEELV